MPGATFGVVNRALVGTWSAATGSLVSGYSVQALNDWQAGNQIRVTPSTNQVTLKCILPAAPSSSSHTQWRITHFGMANHNLDGCDILLKTHTSDNFGASTTRATVALAANMGNANFLVATTNVSERYIWVDIQDTSLVNPVRIGVIFIGLAIDLGYPENDYQIGFQGTSGVIMGPTGIPVAARLSDPIVSRSYAFSDPDKVVPTAIRDYDVATGTTYPTYVALTRLLEKAREVPIDATTVYSGVSAGSGIPIIYNEGAGPGVSDAGRPAYYAICSFRVSGARTARQNPVMVDAVWCNDANNVSVDPVDD